MNAKDFTYLLQNPDKVVSPVQTHQLEEVLEEYPYFQAGRALYLKGLKNLNSFKYNKALKRTAAHTADREVLFDFITSKKFLQNTTADRLSGRTTALIDTEIYSEEVIPQSDSDTSKPSEVPTKTSEDPTKTSEVATKTSEDPTKTSRDTSLPLSKAEADALLDPKLFTSKDPNIDEAISEAKKRASEELEIGEPLPFTKKEKYSFGEWLRLTSYKPVKRNKKPSGGLDEREMEDIHFPLEEGNPKQKKFDLIDKFIADNPKIQPQKDVPKIAIGDSVKFDTKELMTETLAKVYLEQKKFKKAIQAYKILSLKYPEKSGFFADRIKAVERLKDNAP
ncbi:MAG TPA: hypothetical protein VFM69_10750 [Pricia sp.]|nr:hypothetical protein [Pricia sp.]